MQTVLFYIFAAIMVGFGLAVVVNRNPVASALSLVVSFLGLAALFIQLDAFFIGIIQVMVYAGAVMVLFVFIIMLLDLQVEKRRKLSMTVFGTGLIVAVLVGSQITTVVTHLENGGEPKPAIDYQLAASSREAALGKTGKPDFILNKLKAPVPSLPDTHLVGESLYTRFNLHLQVLGVLLLVATLGVVVLSKRKLR